MIVVKNGRLVSSAGVREADVLIDGERIVEVAPALASQYPDIESVDAAGLLIFPGLIDPHTHLREPGGEHKEDFYSGTCAALAGGVTAVFGMPNTSPAMIDEASLDHALSLAAGKAVCDFGLFLGATNANSKLKTQNPALKECGLKIYMGSSTGDLLVEDFAGQFEHFEHYPHERVIAVHAEHELAVRYFAQRGERRPPICAELETARAVTMAARCHRRLHICHLSTRREVEIVAEAKARGVPVTCEYSPHHLFLSTALFKTDEEMRRLGDQEITPSSPFLPSLFEMNPPLRDPAHVEFLWQHLSVADCIATDHAPHTLEEKRSAKPPMGTPGLETMLPLLLTAAHEGRLSLQDIARLCCEGPADTYRIPRKGRIVPGFDADLALVDPNEAWVIGERPLFSKCNWTPFAGWPARGAVKQVFVRGRLAFADGAVVAEKGWGKRIVN
jgi:dihydroorotase (multifunctional complex type)